MTLEGMDNHPTRYIKRQEMWKVYCSGKFLSLWSMNHLDMNNS